VWVQVEDRGQGFDAAGVRARDAALGRTGLASVAERLKLIGGRLEIDAAPRQGTRVTVIVPEG
jgi:signal transduction histidine kinase